MTVINPNSISGITSITLPSGDSNVLTVHTNDGVERFRIDSSGNVKVGSAATISPDGDLFVTGVTTTGGHFAGSGANLTNLPAANVTGTLPAISGANLTSLPAANLTGALPAISGANLTGIAATDNVRTGILDVAGIATFRSDVLVGSAVTLSESGVAAAGLAITCKSLNGQQFSHRNVWINGEFSVAQRGTEQTSITSLSGYATGGPDRCFVVVSNHGTWTVKQGTDSPPGFQNCMEMIATTGDSSVGSDASVRWWQRFEGQNLQRFAKGTSSAKEWTLSCLLYTSPSPRD